MSDATTDTLTLEANQYGKLGVVHCGVSRSGQVTVAGDVTTLADGESRCFRRARVDVRREGEHYRFTRAG